ncbi:peptidase M20 [Ktedonobacteria bacterium brp13]|nr:peptidase M20 [Ktedonobacteria bacterium brp13]
MPQPDDFQGTDHVYRQTTLSDEPLTTLVTTGRTAMEEARPRFLTDLRTLTLIDSPSDDKAGLDAMAGQLEQFLQRVGMQTSIVEHARGSAIVGSIKGNNPTAPELLLIGHHDTVHPLGVAQERTHLEGDKFYGPGTVDMKAGLLQGIYALEILAQQGYRDFSKISFLSVPDEEISNRYHVGLIRQMAQTHPLVLGLEGAGTVGTIVTRRKGCMHYKLTARGLASHAGSSPEQGQNAVLELAHQIVQAQQLMGWRPGFTINAGPIHGGSKANIVSDFAEIIFDVRFLHPEDQLAIEEQWRKLLQNQIVPGVKLTLQTEPDWMIPMVATEESLHIAQQVQLITENILHTTYHPETRGGASDCCNTAAAGCPSIDGLGAIGGGAHTANEYVLLQPIPDRIALLAGLIVALTTKKYSSPRES